MAAQKIAHAAHSLSRLGELHLSDGYDFLKGRRKWLKGDDVTTSSQRGPCVNETQEVPSFRERFFQRVTGDGTQNRENINERKDHSTTAPSQAKSKIL